MDYQHLLRKKEAYRQRKDLIPESSAISYEQAFEIEYTHNSTALEGNTLTLTETKLVLENGTAVGGKQLREIYEQVNHQRAFRYVKKCIARGTPLDGGTVKEIHALLTDHIPADGKYRDREASISGARHTPQSNDMCRRLKDFYVDLLWMENQLNPIEFAAWTHGEFMKIHPFADGNGRTSRLLMNYQLMAGGFLPVSIAKENRPDYLNALNAYAAEGNPAPLTDMTAALEEEELDFYLGMEKQGQQQ